MEYLEQTAARLPDKVAFYGVEDTLTFRQLLHDARAIGTQLIQDGHDKKSIVVFMSKQPKTIAAFLGVIYAGCYYVPLDHEMPRYRIERIMQMLQPAACICDESTLSLVNELENTGPVYLCGELCRGEIDDAALRAVRDRQIDTDPVYIVFTSGSTGDPKGVVGCHRGVIDYIENLCQVLRFHEDTVFGNQTPLCYDACLKEILPTLKYGASTYLIPKKLFLQPVRLVEYLNEKKVNTLCWVVSALTLLSSLKTFDRVKPTYVHTVAFASEVFPIRQLKLWREALPDARFINLYGPTETTGICCYYEVDRDFSEDETLPVGRPFRNTDIILLNEKNMVPAQGEPGEICIRGTRLTHGYYSSQERTREAFVQNPLNSFYPEIIYRTGDIGKYNDRGELVFLSRKDNQIKHMGHRIELGEIEMAADTHEDVQSACCVYDLNTKKLTLFYTGTVSSRELTERLNQKLPRYMLPHRIITLQAMPLTPNGKIDRNLLKQRSTEHG